MATIRPPLLMTRWLALGAAGGAAVVLAIELLGPSGPWPDGPWQGIALVLALLAVFAISTFLFAHQQREQQLRHSAESVLSGEAEISELQREIDRHTQLEQQLTHAKQTAESAVLAKGEFLATMSHEIRTPLNGIVPMLDLLMNARLAPDQYELARTAYTSSQQLLRIVDDILDYSKLEADKLELETTTFNLRELLETVLQLMERPAEAKGLRLHLHIDPAVRLPVRGDPVRLRQVLSNLISNAVKFTERGTVMVNVRRIGESAAQHQLRFEVRDTGIGIAADAQGRLFQAFNQADASTTRLYGGTGLGLAICKRIVDLMGGRIELQSEPGHGATFRFEIPLLKVHGDMPTPELATGGGRLLLLSADPRLRARLSMLLPNWGLRVTSVETTHEALDRLRAAATQGPPWTYSTVLADLAGMRSTALALYRNLERQTVYGDIRLVCLYGEDPVPDELQRSVNLLSRQAPDADLRAALTVRRAQPGNPVEASIATPITPEPASTRHVRVLLVEDNPVNLMVGQRLLGVLGADCDTATNGEAALLRMSASRYDLVLMDCQMPVMDGYTATRRWREHEHAAGDSSHLPIVAMTANAMAGDRQKCLDAGMDDYLAKPVTRGELERCLQQWRRKSAIVPEHSMPELSPSLIALADSVTPVVVVPVTATPATVAPAITASVAPTPVAAVSRSTDAATGARSTEPHLHVGLVESGSAQLPVLDREVLDELRSAIGNDVESLIDLFLDDAPKLIETLETAAAGPDYQALQDAAHSLKSASANMGAMALSAAAKRIELGARMQTLDRPAVAVAMVVVEFARARTALLAQARQMQSAIGG